MSASTDSPAKLVHSENTLTPGEWNILEAIADRIFPPTDTPGAVEAGSLDYIARALAGDYAPCLPLYRKGLKAVDRSARAEFKLAFNELDPDQKDSILLRFEAGEVTGFKKAAEFFEILRYHVLEGVFCEPHYGGNKDMIGWRLAEFPGQQFGYADAYINRRVDLPPVAVNGAEGQDD